MPPKESSAGGGHYPLEQAEPRAARPPGGPHMTQLWYDERGKAADNISQLHPQNMQGLGKRIAGSAVLLVFVTGGVAAYVFRNRFWTRCSARCTM